MFLRSGARGSVLAVVLVAITRLLAYAAPAPETLRAECDYGVTLALQGRFAAAESVFTSLLSHSPGDPRALTNLGNLHLLRGEREAALVFYRLAANMDTSDAGIQLNRATAHYLMGEDSLARADAAGAVMRAGGDKGAESLLGFKRNDAVDGSSKAGDMSARMRFPLKRPAQGQRTAVTRAELRALVAGSAPPPRRPTTPVSRTDEASGGSASEALASAAPSSSERNAAAALYWKR